MNETAAKDLQIEQKPDAALPLRRLVRALARIAALAAQQQSKAPVPVDGNVEPQQPIAPPPSNPSVKSRTDKA
jgi:hypothetical protein